MYQRCLNETLFWHILLILNLNLFVHILCQLCAHRPTDQRFGMLQGFAEGGVCCDT